MNAPDRPAAEAPPDRAYPDNAAFIAICLGFLALSAARALLSPLTRPFRKSAGAKHS